jgi:DNA-binding MarR family transcriptional regulator
MTAVRRLRRKTAMHASTVRHIHASRIFHAIRLNPLISQRELTQGSGFDKSTVSAVVKQFEARGLVERDPRLGEGRPGRAKACASRGMIAFCSAFTCGPVS